MKIRDDHLYHGSALFQIAEHPEFTAINSLKIKGPVLQNSFRINDSIGVHFKYARVVTEAWQEYQFNFPKDELDELSKIRGAVDALLLGLVCVKDREICCLTYEQLRGLVDARKAAKGATTAILQVSSWARSIELCRMKQPTLTI